MDLRAMLNPAEGPAQSQPLPHPPSHSQPQSQPQGGNHLKTPQRAVSLAQPLPVNSHSPPLNKSGLPRTTSLPAQTTPYRRESSASVSPKTMPPPAPVPFHTPSPVMSRKRSLSISDHQATPQPLAKKRRYDPHSPPPWARRERDGHKFIPPPRSEPPPHVNASVTPQSNQHQSAPPSGAPSVAPTTSTPDNYQHQPQARPAASPAPSQGIQGMPPELRYEPCIDNMEPYNDLERQICDFLFRTVVEVPWNFQSPTKVEVEAKLGSIKDFNDDSQRYRLPILTDTVLDPGVARPKFESSMRLDQHSRMNKYLNSAVQQSLRPGRRRVDYRHLRETDYFYEIPAHAEHLIDPAVMDYHKRTGKKGGPRLRVTRDNATDNITAVIIKTRIADLEVRCPNDEFDFRVSVSLETQWQHPGWEQFPEHLDRGVRTARNKDRLSYRHQGFLIDLTQVTPMKSQAQKAEKLHELEIEMDVDKLMDEGFKNLNNQPNQYEELVKVFINNVKVINRSAKVMPGP